MILATDYMDGYLARRWKTVSVTGRILDPVADKICISAVGLALTIYRGFPIALLVGLILRDFIILLASLFSIVKLSDVPVSNIIGKISVGVFSVCLIVFLFDIAKFKEPLVIASAIMIPLSLISYGIRISRNYKSHKSAGELE